MTIYMDVWLHGSRCCRDIDRCTSMVSNIKKPLIGGTINGNLDKN